MRRAWFPLLALGTLVFLAGWALAFTAVGVYLLVGGLTLAALAGALRWRVWGLFIGPEIAIGAYLAVILFAFAASQIRDRVEAEDSFEAITPSPARR